MADDTPKKYQKGSLLLSNLVGLNSDGELRNIKVSDGGFLTLGSDTKDGTIPSTFVVDMEARNTLNNILKQLKIMNTQLTIMTDVCIKNSDVEV